MNKSRRIQFYHWFRYKLLKNTPVTYPTGISRILSFVLFPLDSFYRNQSRINYSYQLHEYTIEGEKVKGFSFKIMQDNPDKEVSLVRNEFGSWEVSKIVSRNP